MPAIDLIQYAGIDGEIESSRPATDVHDITLSKFQDGGGNLEVTVKVLDSGTRYGTMTDVDLAIRVVDTCTGPGDPVGPFFAYDASFRGGVDVPASSIGGPQHIHVDSSDDLWIVPEAPGDLATKDQAAAAGSPSAPMNWNITKQSPWNGTAEAGGTGHAKWIEVEAMTWGDAGSGHVSSTGGTGHYTQIMWEDTTAAHGAGGGGVMYHFADGSVRADGAVEPGGLVYSGESGGMDASIYGQFAGGVFVAAGDLEGHGPFLLDAQFLL